MRARDVEPKDQTYIIRLVNQGYSFKQIEDAYKKAKKTVPPEIASAIAATLQGR
jgi:hypothetical protein